MRRFLLIAFLLIVPFIAPAQGWLWGRDDTTIGESFLVATDLSGNVFGAGGYSGRKSSIVKYDPAGNLLWDNSVYGDTNQSVNITTDVNGNVYLLGAFTGIIKAGLNTLVCPPGEVQYFLVKFDPMGNVLWALNEGNTQMGVQFIGAGIFTTAGIATDAKGNVYITANFQRTSTIVGGNLLHNTDPSGATSDILLAKYDPSGSLVWVKSIGGTGSDNAYSITVTPAGDIYMTGIFGSPSVAFGSFTITNATSGMIAFIGRFDASGNPVWASSSAGMGNEYAIAVASDADNNVYLTGSVWDTAISFSGTTIVNPYAPSRTLYLVKFNPSNNVDWYKIIGWPTRYTISDSGGVLRIEKYGMALSYSVATACGQVWVTGSMYDSLNVDGYTLTSSVEDDPILIAGYTSGGNDIASFSLGSGGDDQDDIACDPSGNIFICGDYRMPPLVVGDTLRHGGEGFFMAKHAYYSGNQGSFTHSYTKRCFSDQESMVLNATSGYSNYFWSNGVIGSTITVKDSGSYWVYGVENCKSSVLDTFKISECNDCSKLLFMPNLFTPNGDGQDDVFYPRSDYGIQLIKSFRVYNRWGEQVFERQNIKPNDVINAWDGSYKGEKPLSEVFVWVVDALCETGNSITKKGSITIIR